MFILHEKYISISAFTSLRTSFLLSPGCSAKRVIKLSAALKEGGKKRLNTEGCYPLPLASYKM